MRTGFLILVFSMFVVFTAGAAAQTAGEFAARANAAVTVGDLEGAIRDATEAIKLDGATAAAFLARGQAYAKIVEKEKRPPWLPALGKLNPKSEDAEKAISDLNRAIELDPKNPFALGYRGLVYYFLNDLETALPDFKTAAELAPDKTWFKNNYETARKRLSVQYASAGGELRNKAVRVTVPADKEKMLRDAIVLQNKAIALEGSSEDNFSSRAFTFEELGEFEAAAADMTQSIRLAPDRYLNYYRRGKLFNRLKRYADAVADFRKGLQIVERLSGDIELPQNDLRTEIAKNLALDGKFDDAFAMFDLALGARSPSYITYHERGKAYLLKGDLERAEADFRKAVEVGRGYNPSADELRKMGKTP